MEKTVEPTDEVTINELCRPCSFPMRVDAIAASDNCNQLASSAVIDPNTGNKLWRCDGHEGQLRSGRTSEIVRTLPRAFIDTVA